jgi:hypothetical protein
MTNHGNSMTSADRTVTSGSGPKMSRVRMLLFTPLFAYCNRTWLRDLIPLSIDKDIWLL